MGQKMIGAVVSFAIPMKLVIGFAKKTAKEPLMLKTKKIINI